MATSIQQTTDENILEPLDDHHVFYDSVRQYCRDNNLDRAVAGDWVEASPTSYQKRERKRMLRRSDHSTDDVIPKPQQIEAPGRRLKPIRVEEPDTVRTDGGTATVEASTLTASETTTISSGVQDVNSQNSKPSKQESPPSVDSVDSFKRWCDWNQSYEGNTAHSYTRKAANAKLCNAFDCERYFVQEYDEYTTVWISFSIDDTSSYEGRHDHAQAFFPRAVSRRRRAILKELGVWDEYAGLRLLAPRETGKTHAHLALVMPGHHSPETFEPILDAHTDATIGATERDNPPDAALSVEHHTSAEVEIPSSLLDDSRTNTDALRERTPTSALPHEIANNLPMLRCEIDARGLNENYLQWCAEMRSAEIRRFRPLGKFREYADTIYARREGDAQSDRVQDSNSQQSDSPTDSTHHQGESSLSSKQRAFIAQYTGGSSRQEIATALREWTDERLASGDFKIGPPIEQTIDSVEQLFI